MTNEHRAAMWLIAMEFNTDGTPDQKRKALTKLLDDFEAEVKFVELKTMEAAVDLAMGTKKEDAQ